MDRKSAANPLAIPFDLDAREEMPVAALCNGMLREALREGYERLNFIREGEDEGSLRVERRGEWEEMMHYPGRMHPAIVSRLKIMGNLKIDRRPSQKGEMHVRYNGEEIALQIEVRRLSDDEEAVSIGLPRIKPRNVLPDAAV